MPFFIVSSSAFMRDYIYIYNLYLNLKYHCAGIDLENLEKINNFAKNPLSWIHHSKFYYYATRAIMSVIMLLDRNDWNDPWKGS